MPSPQPDPTPAPGDGFSPRHTAASDIGWREGAAAIGARVPIAYGRVRVVPPAVLAQQGIYSNVRFGKFGVVWSEGPIHSIEAWHLFKLLGPGGRSISPVEPAGGGGYVSIAIDPDVYFQYHGTRLGTLSQTALPSGGLGPMPGVAHSYVETAFYKPTYPAGILKGRLLYDRRLGAWASGDYPPDAYCAWSANPALQAADLLTNPQYGLAVPTSLVDWDSVAAAADYCDELVDGVPRWECHIYIRERRKFWEWMKTILLHFGGSWGETNGRRSLAWAHAEPTADVTITDDDLAKGIQPRVSDGSGAGLADLPNRVTVEWTDPTSWTTRTVSAHTAAVDAGAAVREGEPYKLHGLQSEKAAQRAARRILGLTASARRLEATLLPRQVGLGRGTALAATLDSLSLSDSRWILTDRTEQPNGDISVVGQEHETAIFDDTATGDTPPDDGWLGTPPALAAAVYKPKVEVAYSMTEEIVTGYPGVLYDLPTFFFSKAVRMRCAIGGVNVPGPVATLTVHNAGSGYAVDDPITITGEGSSATAKVSAVDGGGAITGCLVMTGGSGYWPQTTLAVAGGSGTGAELRVSIGAPDTDLTTLVWDDEELARNEYVLPWAGNEPQTDATKAWAVISSLVASTETTVPVGLFDGGSVLLLVYALRLMIRLESQAGVLGPASTFDVAADAAASTTANPVEPVTYDSSSVTPTANRLVKFTGAAGATDNSKFSDDGTTPKYDGVALLREGDVAGAGAPVGAIVSYPSLTPPDGWLLCDGSTIGDASSGATARANADTEDLFTLLWGSWANTELTIQDSSGTPTTRGASAAADFAAHKRLPVPDHRQRFILGKAGSGTGSTLGATGGAIDHVHSVDPPTVDVTDDGVGDAAISMGLGVHPIVEQVAFDSAAANPPFIVEAFIVCYAGTSGGGGASLTVKEADGSPSVASVTELQVDGGTVTDLGGGVAKITVTGGGGTTPVLATDSFVATASQTDFVLSNSPLANGVTYVTRDGVVAKASDWSLSTDTVVFGTGLDAGVEVQVGYWRTAPSGSTPYGEGFVATAGQTDFPLTHTATAVLIVAVGIVQATTAWSLTGGGTTLTFTSGLVAGDDVWIAYLY